MTDNDAEGILGPLYAAELILNESSLSVPPAGALDLADLDRANNLERCLASIAAFWDFLDRIPSEDFVGFTFSFYSYLAHNLLSLYGLSVMDDPACDRNAVRSRLDVLSVLDRFCEKLQEVSRTGGLADEALVTNSFAHEASIKASVRAKWSAELTGDESALPYQVHVAQPPPPLPLPLPPQYGAAVPGDPLTFGASDETWFRDIFVPWEDGWSL